MSEVHEPAQQELAPAANPEVAPAENQEQAPAENTSWRQLKTDSGKVSPNETGQPLAPELTNLPVMLTSFADVKLLRASSSGVLLSGFGAILGDNAGSEETYNLSQPISRIRWFVSHNWSTPRIHKFAVLALTFNFYPAVFVTAIAMIGLLALTACGALPLVNLAAQDSDYEPNPRSGITAQLVGPLIFLFVLFTWQELASALGLLSTKVFLDKTCIHQVDDELKRQGIMSLAAFLGKTDGMLVLYTPTYLKRLWTVFELGSLVILYPEKELKVVPVFFAHFVVAGLATVFLYMGIFQLGQMEVVEVAVGGWAVRTTLILNVLAACIFSFVTFIWARQKEEMRASIMNFRMSDAACMDEADRNLVRKSVEVFMKRRSFVENSVSREEALLAFEKMIQKDVTPRLLRATGLQGIPYKYIVAIWTPRLFRLVDRFGAFLLDGHQIRFISIVVINQLCTVFFVIPALLAFTSLLMQTSAHVSGCRSVAVVLGASLALNVATFATALGMAELRDFAQESLWGVASVIVFQLAFVGLFWVSHSWLPRKLYP